MLQEPNTVSGKRATSRSEGDDDFLEIVCIKLTLNRGNESVLHTGEDRCHVGRQWKRRHSVDQFVLPFPSLEISVESCY